MSPLSSNEISSEPVVSKSGRNKCRCSVFSTESAIAWMKASWSWKQNQWTTLGWSLRDGQQSGRFADNSKDDKDRQLLWSKRMILRAENNSQTCWAEAAVLKHSWLTVAGWVQLETRGFSCQQVLCFVGLLQAENLSLLDRKCRPTKLRARRSTCSWRRSLRSNWKDGKEAALQKCYWQAANAEQMSFRNGHLSKHA